MSVTLPRRSEQSRVSIESRHTSRKFRCQGRRLIPETAAEIQHLTVAYELFQIRELASQILERMYGHFTARERSGIRGVVVFDFGRGFAERAEYPFGDHDHTRLRVGPLCGITAHSAGRNPAFLARLLVLASAPASAAVSPP